jgi:hypothetical protein
MSDFSRRRVAELDLVRSLPILRSPQFVNEPKTAIGYAPLSPIS